MIRVAPFKLEAYLTARGGDPLRALLGLAAGDCIDAGVDGMAGMIFFERSEQYLSLLLAVSANQAV
ncbi:hypothetical protein D3C73_1263610 [compost metagenome]